MQKPCEVVGTNVSIFKNNTLLYIVDYCSKFPIIKQTDSLSADSLVRVVKIVFA